MAWKNRFEACLSARTVKEVKHWLGSIYLLREADSPLDPLISGWGGFILFPKEGRPLTEQGSCCKAELIGPAGGEGRKSWAGTVMGWQWMSQWLSIPSIYCEKSLSWFTSLCGYPSPLLQLHLVAKGKTDRKKIILSEVSYMRNPSQKQPLEKPKHCLLFSLTFPASLIKSLSP